MIQFPDLNKLVYDLHNAGDAVKDGAKEAVEEVIGRISATGAVLAPRDTEATALSIDDDVWEEAGKVIGESGPHTRQAPFMEWGTYKDAPQAFMGPALDRHSHELDAKLGEAGERAIDRGFFGNLFGIDL